MRQNIVKWNVPTFNIGNQPKDRKISKVSGTNSAYTYFTDSQEISDKKVYWNREIVNMVDIVKLLEK